MVSSRKSKTGLSPGTLIHVGRHNKEKTKITSVHYSHDSIEEKELTSLDQLHEPHSGVTWVNISGVHNVQTIEQIGKRFALHPLLLEDVMNTSQRPKFEQYGTYGFFVLRMIQVVDNALTYEQVSIVIGKNFVITFQEKEGDVFDPIRTRIKEKKRIREKGADYLAYALVDTIVDYYFIVLEWMTERIDQMENRVLHQADDNLLPKIQALKREVIFLRKTTWPLRDLVTAVEHKEQSLFTSETLLYFRDVHDHSTEIIDTIQMFRDQLAGILDLNMTFLSNKTNDVMRVLTIIATIFIPLTFVTGVYGMNFEHMPELGWRYSYFIIWGVMILATIIMILLFRKRKWI